MPGICPISARKIAISWDHLSATATISDFQIFQNPQDFEIPDDFPDFPEFSDIPDRIELKVPVLTGFVVRMDTFSDFGGPQGGDPIGIRFSPKNLVFYNDSNRIDFLADGHF